ncbi:MAG: response regulator transcription factor, partial [Burkholderiales bacterium]
MTMEKIAVIEDDASVQRALAIRLTSHGYRVVTAQDVASAIAVIRAENPALLLVDVCIPGGDGFQVVERVRRMPKMAKIPVLFIT